MTIGMGTECKSQLSDLGSLYIGLGLNSLRDLGTSNLTPNDYYVSAGFKHVLVANFPLSCRVIWPGIQQ